MDGIVDAWNKFAGIKSKKDDDFFDRLSSRYTVLLILVFAAVVTFYQFGGSPIICWAPVHFTGSHTKYANSYCWVRNTYYLPFEDEIPRAHEEEKRQVVTYYQWMPFILLMQALLFYLPSVVWHGLNSRGGIDSDNILASANKLTKTEKEEARETTLRMVCNQIDRFLGSRQEIGFGFRNAVKKCFMLCSKRFGSFLVMLFLFSKLLYIANVFFQIFILNKILSTKYNLFGFEVMKGMAADHNWHDSPYTAFPRVTMCDFNVRRLGNVHRYTLQCTLPLNLWNEKIYAFLWFWMVMVAALSIISFIQWFIRAIFRCDRIKFVQNHLKLMNRLKTDRDIRNSHDFLDKYLRQDGAFVLRLIAHNTNNITTTDIICQLWDKWKDSPRKPNSFLIEPTLEPGDEKETSLA